MKLNISNYSSNNLILELKKSISEAKDQLIFVYFSAKWCGECKMSNLVFQKLKSIYEDKFLFFQIDVDKAKLWEDAENEFFKIKKVPTFLIYRNEDEISRYFNFKPLDFHQQEIKKNIF